MFQLIRNGDDIHPLRAILSYAKRRKNSKEREDGVFPNHFQWISHLTLQEYCVLGENCNTYNDL